MKLNLTEANRLTTLFYLLIRDHLPFGVVERLMQTVVAMPEGIEVVFSEPNIEAWANAQVARLSTTCLDVSEA